MNKKISSWHYLLLLIVAGESVFILPFVLSRVFRPTVLDSFAIDNIQLGLCFSVYGIVAMLSYLLGGPLADKYAPRKLISIALWMTGAGGFIYASFPSYGTLKILYGYWGFTTIFLFWAPMIKAARVWGGKTSQGKAFGFLDGGRGLVGALFGSLGVFIFSLFITTSVAEVTAENSKEAFRYVIWVSSIIVIIVGIFVWLFMKINRTNEQIESLQKISTVQIREVLKLPSVWLLMIIILCAYVGYKITDVLSLYAKEVMLYDEVNSAKVGTFLLFIRPIIGVIIGILADRSHITRWLSLSFAITFIGALMFSAGVILPSTSILFFFSILVVSTGVYAARSLYFAVMEKGQIPVALTGTAVGLISIVGYTPDIFAGPLMGYLLENSPGELGHRHVFIMLAIFSFVGGMAAYYYSRLYRNIDEYPRK